MKKFQNLSKFVNKAKDQIFNDALVDVLVLEIKLKSKEINEYMILPTNTNKNVMYGGEIYEKSKMISGGLSQKTLKELKELVIIGSEINFNSKTEIKNWIVKETDITDCALSHVN